MNSQAPLARDHRPVYIQIAETLKARIISGFYANKLDGELPLAREWKVSRRTIQQALNILVDEGLVRRQHGMGTFINRKGVENGYHAITSITEGIAGQGLTPESSVLSSGLAPGREGAQQFFRLAPGEHVYYHRRLVSAEDRPLALVETGLDPKLLEGLELSHLHGSLYAALRNQFGRTIVHAQDSYIPTVADRTTAELLAIEEGSPIFHAIRRATDQTGAPIELSEIFMLPVPLDISIDHIGFSQSSQDRPAPEKREWQYMVGFGNFRR